MTVKLQQRRRDGKDFSKHFGQSQDAEIIWGTCIIFVEWSVSQRPSEAHSWKNKLLKASFRDEDMWKINQCYSRWFSTKHHLMSPAASALLCESKLYNLSWAVSMTRVRMNDNNNIYKLWIDDLDVSFKSHMFFLKMLKGEIKRENILIVEVK